MAEEKTAVDRKAEFLDKRERLNTLMEQLSLDAILLRRQDNFAWAGCGANSAVTVNSDTGVGSLLLRKNGDNLLVSNNIESQRLLVEEGLAEIGYAAAVFPWTEDGEKAAVAGLVGDIAKIGCDTVFAGARLIDSELVTLRRRLTEGERERYLFLGRALSTAVETAMYTVRQGEKEGEIAGRIAAELWKDRIDVTNFLVAFDERIGKYRHPITVNRTLDRIAMLSVNARYKGLIATITRLGHIGPIPETLLKQYYDNIVIECRMIAATVPGALERDILGVASAAYAEFGHPGEEAFHHQGGPMGYQSRDAITVPSSQAVVGKDEAYCWNPTICGTKSEDGFIVDSQGQTFITSPVCFPTLDIVVGDEKFRRPAMLEIR